MAPWTAKEQPTQAQEPHLNTLLSPEQSADLAVLITSIAEVMRKQTAEAFDSKIPSGKNPQKSLPSDNKGHGSNDVQHHIETKDEQAANELQEKREKELSEPKQQELKNTALDYLQKWQELVIARVIEVMASKDLVDNQHESVQVAAALTPETAPPPDNKTITSKTNIEDADAALIGLYPPTSTSLYSLPKEKRILLLHAMLLLLLSLEHYVAPSRVLLLHIASSLHLPLHILAENEVTVAKGLVDGVKHIHMSGDEETEKRSQENKNARRWKVGLAGVAGAALIGVTGGLAAPLVAAGIGTVMGGLGLGASAAAGLLGTLAESGVVVGALFGAYGGRMTGRMMDEYAKEVQDFAFLPLRGSKSRWHNAKDVATEERRLRVTIGISGWLTQKEDVITPWRILGHQSEVFALRWELEALMKLGTSMETVVKSAAWTIAKKEIIARTIFATLMDALWPIAILKISKVIDNPFSVAKNMADKAGLVLADAIINKAQGERPVTLIGYSLGARLIYSCLMSLAERKAFGLIESVALIGTPAPSDAKMWRAMRSVVAGRLVNVYSENDYILAFLNRTSSTHFKISGIQEVEDVKGVENFNVSEMVSGHLRYQYLIGSILQKIGWEDIDAAEVAKEEETLSLLDEEEEKEGKKNAEGKKSLGEDPDRLEKEVEEKSGKSLLQHTTGKLHLG